MNFNQYNTRRLSIALTMGAVVALGLLLYAPVFGQFSTDLITQPIDESQLVTVVNSTRPEASPQNDRGPVPDSFPLPHMLLQLKRSPVMESELAQYIEQLTNKSSPNFHKWISALEIGEKYGPSQNDLSILKGWLESHGFTVNGIQPNRMVIDISGTAANIRGAFHTQVDYLNVGGVKHFANMTNQKLPSALTPAVMGIVQVHDFLPQMNKVPIDPDYYISSSGLQVLVPADFQTIYNVDPLFRQGYHGEGQTITIVEDSDSYKNDIATYRAAFLSKYTGTVTTIHPGSGCTDPGTNVADGEADLDGEVASAMAPNASIVLAVCADTTTFGGLIALENLVNANSPPSIVSISYGECEAANGAVSNAAFNSAYQTAAGEGSSIFVSTGDAGSSQCAPLFFSGASLYAYPGTGVTGWGESIYNVSVGGTDFEDVYNAAKAANGGLPTSTYFSTTNTPTDGSAKSYVPEIPWNDSCAGYLIYSYEGYTSSAGTAGFCNSTIATNNNAFLTTAAAAGGPSGCATGGGSTDQTSSAVVDGTCAGYAKPSWQAGIFGNPSDGVRDIPDVSLFASNGFWGHYAVVCFSDTAEGGTSCAGAPSTWSGFGGTSVAAPLMAGIQALVAEYHGLTKFGNPDPIYYAIASQEFGASGNSSCYSVNLPARHGLSSSCVFQDITQGDNDVDCRTNGQLQASCYLPSATNGAISTQAISKITVTAGGSGYTSATCSIAAPYNLSPYLSPFGIAIYPGGSQATCTPQFGTPATSTITISGTPSSSFAGTTVTVAGTTYTFVTTLTGAPNQVLLYTSGGTSTKKYVTADNLQAAISGNSVICGTVPPCFGAGTVANGKVTTTAASGSNVITLTSTTTGTAGNYAQTTSNPSLVTVSSVTTGTAGTNVGLVTVSNGGAGYTGNSPCTITGNGAGATCIANAQPTVAPSTYQPAWGATPGWDFATGLGSVNAYNLAINPAW